LGDVPNIVDDKLSIEQQVIAALRRIVRAIDLHSRHLMEEVGLTGPQLLALQAAARLGRVPVGSLARDIHVSHPTMSGIVDRLERRGLMVRVRDEADRRRIGVTVTDQGHIVLARAPSPLQERFRAELAKLEEWERTLMLSSLQRIAAMMDAERLPASPVLTTGTAVAPAGPANTVQAAPLSPAFVDDLDREVLGTVESPTASSHLDGSHPSHQSEGKRPSS
jgi:DNA-binding MarR family transcriptional regulator